MAETGDFNFRKSFKELVKKIKQYQYNSVRFWNKLDNTFEAEIFKTAITRSPEIIEAKLQFEKEQKLLEEKLLKDALLVTITGISNGMGNTGWRM